jgi:vancomycin permeability regulator SanA
MLLTSCRSRGRKIFGDDGIVIIARTSSTARALFEAEAEAEG